MRGTSTQKINIGIICLSLAAAVGVSGCDFIKTIQEYFQEQPAKTSPALEPPAVEKPQAAQPPVSAPVAPPVVQAPIPENVLARVENWTLTTEDFNDRLNALKEVVPDFDITSIDAKKLVLEELIRQQLLVLEAERTGLANQKDINAAVEEFRRTLIVQEAVKKLTTGLAVSDEEARAFYEEQKDDLVEPAQWHLRSIVVDSQLRANEISVELLKGSDFAEMARQNSIASNAGQGGDLGFIAQMPFPEMESALLPLKAGDISGVFKGPDGYYIVKVEEKKEGQPVSFEEIKEEIKQRQLLFKQQQAILDHLEKLRGQTKIEVKENF